MRKGKSSLGFIIVLVAVSFFVLSWSTNNPRQARKIKNNCSQVMSDVYNFATGLLPEDSNG